MRTAVLIVYILMCCAHLYASLKKNTKLRAYTKVFLLPLLGWWYCLSVSAPSWIVIAALLFSWLGDVLLIPKGIPWFTAGGIAFMASHAFFCLAYKPQIVWASLPPVAVVLSVAAYLAAVCLLMRRYRPNLPKPLFVPMAMYLCINGTMNCFALYQLISLPCAATVITYVGAVLFFTSDSALFSTRFVKNSVFKNHFFVMLTYLIAEFLIALGLVMLR